MDGLASVNERGKDCEERGRAVTTSSDAAFRRRPGVRVIDPTPEAIAAFFGITTWPRDVVQYDLGGRIVDIVPIPGHERASIAIYDRRTGILLTGRCIPDGST